MKGKVFIGGWVSSDTRKKFKIACAVHDINQGDVIDLLLMNWINKPHVQEEIKNLLNDKTEENG
jgi:hypothetical protein